MPIKSQLVERESQDGEKYFVIEIYLTDNYTKVVGLKRYEKELLVLSRQVKS